MKPATADHPRAHLHLVHSNPPVEADQPTSRTTRKGRVHTRTHRLQRGYENYPLIRLSGRWLEKAGFGRGQPYEVEVEKGRLTIQAV